MKYRDTDRHMSVTNTEIQTEIQTNTDRDTDRDTDQRYRQIQTNDLVCRHHFCTDGMGKTANYNATSGGSAMPTDESKHMVVGGKSG